MKFRGFRKAKEKLNYSYSIVGSLPNFFFPFSLYPSPPFEFNCPETGRIKMSNRIRKSFETFLIEIWRRWYFFILSLYFSSFPEHLHRIFSPFIGRDVGCNNNNNWKKWIEKEEKTKVDEMDGDESCLNFVLAGKFQPLNNIHASCTGEKFALFLFLALSFSRFFSI